ncbi:MAG: tetratricopeptide repeat protein [Bdellovibrionales bacterium]|nr:tetratricopeptide repeat protein [Ramlibacter sp.]
MAHAAFLRAVDVPAGAAEQQRGNALLDQGRLEEAATCYCRATLLDPTSVAGWVNLGFVLKELGRATDAADALNRAVALDATQFDANFMLGLLAQEQRDVPGAIRHFSRALELQPSSSMVSTELCTAAFQDGQMALATRTVQHGLRLDPMSAELHYLAGNLLSHEGRHDEAIASFERALAIAPVHPPSLHNLGQALRARGRLDEAVASFRKAISLNSAYGQAHASLAAALTAQGRLQEAIASCRQALALDPRDLDALNNLGNAQQAQGLLPQAIDTYGQALALQPEHLDSLGNMGLALHAQGRYDEAAGYFRRVLAIAPSHALAHNNLGNTLQKQNRLDEAVSSYQRALAADPSLAQAHSNIAGARHTQGEHALAIASWRDALRIQPDYFDAWSNLLYALNFLPGCTPAEYLKEARRFGAAVSASARPWRSWLADAGRAKRPLRVGLVSGDLRAHPVGLFLESIIAHLDFSRIELVAYSNFPQEDQLTARIKPAFARWHSIVGLSDEAAATLIHDDAVDVLLDLSGHTAYNRLPLFAWKPAPVQASWLGYFSSTGVPGMDYLLADEVGVPPACQAQFTEAVWYLPDTRLCFTAPAFDDIAPGALPALSSGRVTFGCFQNMIKLNDQVLALWGQLFKAMPDALLCHQSKQMREPALREQLLLRLEAVGIERSKTTLIGPVDRRAFLKAHNGVDIMLDTFPGTGGTTTCEALWMGVPTMTLAGDSLLARQGASLLNCAGLAGWVAQSPAEFVGQLAAHGSDRQALSSLRARLRAQALASPLFNASLFAGRLQQALEQMRQQTHPA